MSFLYITTKINKNALCLQLITEPISISSVKIVGICGNLDVIGIIIFLLYFYYTVRFQSLNLYLKHVMDQIFVQYGSFDSDTLSPHCLESNCANTNQ